MNDNSCQQPHLISWYRRFLEDGKSAAFVRVVASRYTLSTLQRLTTSADHDLRRATVLALGMLAGGESIPVVGRRLCDKDRCVRLVAEVAFSDLTRREMGVEAGQALDQARRHIGGERFEKALHLLNELLEIWPKFGEAWYQRGIVDYCLGEYDLALNCARQAVSCNPFHFAVHTLRGRCCLELDQPLVALRYFRHSFAINPSQVVVRGYIDVLTRQQQRLNLDDSAP